MKIVSPAFLHNTLMPSKYTRDGENISPSLAFSDVPQNAESLVLIVDDPDATTGMWVHWVVYNIKPSTQNILENTIPDGGILGITDFGKAGYGGPCPPSGTHRYFFKLYALDTQLSLGPNATKKEIEDAMENHVLEKAELVGLYKKKDPSPPSG